MTRKAALLLILLLLLLLFPRSVGVAQRFQQPPEMPRDLAGGRPGAFHFVTNEQARADRTELADLHLGVERVQRILPRISDPVAQREVAAELERWSLHLARLSQRGSAGPTAAVVESRLNQMKGQRSCGICHGGPPDTTRTSTEY